MNINHEIQKCKERLRQVKRRAATELCTNGYTKELRKLYREFEQIEGEIADLEDLDEPYGRPKIGFAADPPARSRRARRF